MRSGCLYLMKTFYCLRSKLALISEGFKFIKWQKIKFFSFLNLPQVLFDLNDYLCGATNGIYNDISFRACLMISPGSKCTLFKFIISLAIQIISLPK